jgi:FlaA1/EpsC-like NDP-sugar epimerase
VGEYNPDEMVKTNVLGTMNVIEAAIAAGVKRVVALSTDKACQPITTYGASKFMAEKLIIGANATGGGNTEFGVCRYGNVAGSNGSVIPYWKKLIEQDPDRILPVTDARCTRFWMTPKQAVDMVTWMATEDEHHLLAAPVLNAYRITDLAQAMWRPYHEVGMRAVEKIHETMWSEEEAKTLTWTDAGYLTISATPRKTSRSAIGTFGRSDQAYMMSVAELSRALSELEEA